MNEKELLIENKVWKGVKNFITKEKLKNRKHTLGEILSYLLIEYDSKRIETKDSIEESKKTGRKANLTDEALLVYQSLPTGTKSYVVNGLLRRWLEIKN